MIYSRSAHLRQQIGEECCSTEGEDGLHQAVNVVAERQSRRRASRSRDGSRVLDAVWKEIRVRGQNSGIIRGAGRHDANTVDYQNTILSGTKWESVLTSRR